ncbi:unnamed protein product [Lampetra fluviatilis]
MRLRPIAPAAYADHRERGNAPGRSSPILTILFEVANYSRSILLALVERTSDMERDGSSERERARQGTTHRDARRQPLTSGKGCSSSSS